MERNGQPYAFRAQQNETHAPWPGSLLITCLRNKSDCVSRGRPRDAACRFNHKITESWAVVLYLSTHKYTHERTHTHAAHLDWIPSMSKCLCLDGSCEPSGPDYSDPTQLDDLDFLVHKAQLHTCAASWIHAGVTACANRSVLAARVPCRVPNKTTDRDLRANKKKHHHKNRTRCRALDSAQNVSQN